MYTTVLLCTLQYCYVHYSTAMCTTVLLCALQYCYVHYSTAMYTTVLLPLRQISKDLKYVSILLWKYPVPNFSPIGPKMYKTHAKGNLCRYMKCCFCCAISIPAASSSSSGQVSCPVPIQN